MKIKQTEEPTIKEIWDSMTKEQHSAIYVLVGRMVYGERDIAPMKRGPLRSLTKEQRELMQFIFKEVRGVLAEEYLKERRHELHEEVY